MSALDNWKKLSALLDEVEAYYRISGKVSFDMECCAPEEGMEKAGDDCAILGKRIFSLVHSKRYTTLLLALKEDTEGLNDIQKRTVSMLLRNYEREKNISSSLSYQYDLVTGRAYTAWLTAKKTNDFSKFAPSFAKVVDLTRKLVAVRDKQFPTPYDALLNDYEPNGSMAGLDAFFDKLKTRIVPLLKRIETEGKPIREDFMSRPCPIPKQEEFSRFLLEKEGLRKTALVLMTTEHPFTTNFGPNDVRVTTHYYENNFVSNIFTTLHEGGHALFMQYEPEELYKNHAADRMTSAMHECISRFYENIVGRSRAFIHFLYPTFRKIGGKTFADVTEDELYRAVNAAHAGLNRCDSDELTYSLHVLVRYELEKLFVNGEIKVDEIPAIWNRKYKEYLGVDVPNDTEGCLQDVHWVSSYGYFPSYALGNAYGAQIFNTMKKDFDVEGAIREGKLSLILDWLKEKVFSISSMVDPDEWIVRITGEPLNVDYYLDYLEAKMTDVYGLS